MPETLPQPIRLLVCESCGPTNLVEGLAQGIRDRGWIHCRVEAQQAPCLLACRFKQVVKVIGDDGRVLQSFSSVARNGFQALSDDPVAQLLDAVADCFPPQAPVAAVRRAG